jgi:hypothetical protein
MDWPETNRCELIVTCCRVYDRQDGFLWALSGNAAMRVGETELKGGATETKKALLREHTQFREHTHSRTPSFLWFFVLLCVLCVNLFVGQPATNFNLYFVYCTGFLFLPAGNRWNNSPFRVASRQLATCEIQRLIFYLVSFPFRLRLTWCWQQTSKLLVLFNSRMNLLNIPSSTKLFNSLLSAFHFNGFSDSVLPAV